MKYFFLSIAVTLGLSMSAQVSDATALKMLQGWEWNGTNCHQTGNTGSTTSRGPVVASLSRTDIGDVLLLSGLGHICGTSLSVVDARGFVNIDGVRSYASVISFQNKNAVIVLSSSLVAKLKAGNKFSVVFSDGCGVENTGNLSLKGFTRAYNAL